MRPGRPRTVVAVLRAAGLALAACGAAACGGDASSEREEGALARLDGPAAGAASGEAPLAVDVPPDAPVVAFLGNSIGAGLHLPEHRAFPAVLQRRLADEHPFRLVNASESGRTTAGGVTAVDWVLRSEPDVVVIELGGNDGLRGIDLGEVERNLGTLIERVRAGGAEVLLLGVRLFENYGEYAEAFDALYPALAGEYGVAFVPHFLEGVGGVPEHNLADGLHPTAEGHELLAENVLPALREVLAGLRSGPEAESGPRPGSAGPARVPDPAGHGTGR